jgi:DNA-binding CsgD family transcriptional regulator
VPRPFTLDPAPIVSAYHLRARLITGPLRSPTRDESRDVESDDRSELLGLAVRLQAEGFTVWIFRHGTPPLPGASDLTVDERLDPVPDPPPGAGARRSRRAGRRLRIVAGAPTGATARGCGLTPWEVEVLVLLMRGRTNDEIATRLGVDRQVVDVGVRSLLSGLGARDRVDAAVLLLRGVVPLPA